VSHLGGPLDGLGDLLTEVREAVGWNGGSRFRAVGRMRAGQRRGVLQRELEGAVSVKGLTLRVARGGRSMDGKAADS